MNKRRFFVLLTTLILATLVFTACDLTTLQDLGTTIRGSGNVVTQEEAITGFDKLDVDQGFLVNVRQGDDFSVVIRVDDNIVEHLQVAREGDTLRIGLEPGRQYSIQEATMEADVTMPLLAGLDLNGGSHVTLSGIKSSEQLDADLSGGSHLRGDIEAGDVKFDLSGGSDVELSGAADNLTVDASGGSHARLANLAVVDANVDASGGSHATVNPSGKLDAVANGGSHVSYLGNPTLGTMDEDNASSIGRE